MNGSPRALRWLLPLGPVAALAVLGLGAPHQSRPERDALGLWLTVTTGPWRALHWKPASDVALPTAVAVFVLLWVALSVVLARHRIADRLVLRAAAWWAAPFAVGAPFLSRDIYAYVAQGDVLRRGLDPYTHPPAALGTSSSVLQSVDPMWRHATPPYGPLALRVQEAAATVGGGHEWLALLALRLVAVVSVVLAVHLVRRLVPAPRKALATWLAVNPLVLLQLVGAAHLEALLTVLLLAAVTLAMRNELAPAAAVATLAVQVKATAAVVVVALVLHALLRNGPRPALRMGLASVGTFLASAYVLLPQDPFGWVKGLQTPTTAWNPFTPSSTLYLFVSEVCHRLGVRMTPGVETVVRSFVVAVGLALVVVALRKARERSAAWTAAVTLTLVSLSAPVVWPWYLGPCTLLLVAANRFTFAAVLGSVPALAALTVPVVRAQRVAVAAELVGGAVFAALLVARRTGRGPGWAHEPAGRRTAPHAGRARAGRR